MSVKQQLTRALALAGCWPAPVARVAISSGQIVGGVEGPDYRCSFDLPVDSDVEVPERAYSTAFLRQVLSYADATLAVSFQAGERYKDGRPETRPQRIAAAEALILTWGGCRARLWPYDGPAMTVPFDVLNVPGTVDGQHEVADWLERAKAVLPTVNQPSTKSVRYVLAGVLVTPANVVGTDGYVLTTTGGLDLQNAVLVDGKLIRCAIDTLALCGGKVLVKTGQGSVQFEHHPDVVITLRQMDGNYPDWQQIVYQPSDGVELLVAELTRALATIRHVAAYSNRVELDFRSEMLVVSCHGVELGSMTLEIPLLSGPTTPRSFAFSPAALAKVGNLTGTIRVQWGKGFGVSFRDERVMHLIAPLSK